MATATPGTTAAFAYDFGVRIARGTVQQIGKLAGVSLTLASAFYSLNQTAEAYNQTLHKNILHFGGMVSTMKAMTAASERLLKGMSYFSVDDQLQGMRSLMRVGLDAEREFEWINKASHALNMEFSQFSNAVASAISGNMGQLVEMGIMTERATRRFEKYQANTVMRQKAIMDELKNHKGLMNAINSDYLRVMDQVKRIRQVWRSVMLTVLGNPRNPESLYAQTVGALKMVAEKFTSATTDIKKRAWQVGQLLGWTVKTIGQTMIFLGRQFKIAMNLVWKVGDDFQERTRSLIVWLEFWKVRISRFFKDYSKQIQTVLQLLIAFKALKGVFVISKEAITSVVAWGTAISGVLGTILRNLPALLGIPHRIARFFRLTWALVVSFAANVGVTFRALFASISAGIYSIPVVGWIAAIVAAIVVLYRRCEWFRNYTNKLFTYYREGIKFIWNALNYLWVLIVVGAKKAVDGVKNAWYGLIDFLSNLWGKVRDTFNNIWEFIKEEVRKSPFKDSVVGKWLIGAYNTVKNWIKDLWSTFMDSKVAQWFNTWIIQPLKTAVEWIWGIIQKIGAFFSSGPLSRLNSWLAGANNAMKTSGEALASEYGVKTAFASGNAAVVTTPDWMLPQSQRKGDSVSNPIIEAQSTAPVPVAPQTEQVTCTFQNGAITINVPEGTKVDERALTSAIRKEIEEYYRSHNMRGGNI